MADEERTIKFTFTAEDKDLLESFKRASDQAKALQETLGRVATAAAAKQKTGLGGKDAAEVSTDRLEAAEDTLGVLKKQTAELRKIKSLTKDIAKNSDGGGGGFLDSLFGGGGGGGGKGKGGLATIAGKLLKLGTGIGGAALAAVASQMRLGHAAMSEYEHSLAGLAGTGATRAGMDRARNRGAVLGYSPVTTMEQALAAAKATGDAGAVTYAQQVSRATSLDVGEATSLMGSLTRLGTGGFGGAAGTQGLKQTEKMIKLGLASGLEEARLPEYLKGVDTVVTEVGALKGGDIDSAEYAKFLQAMGATGASGLQGARGAAVFSKLNQSIIKPGGGEIGQALMLQAFGFGKPGGNTSYYDALKRQEAGAKPGNVRALFRETESQYGRGEEQILGLREITGLGITVLEELRKAAQISDKTTREEEITKILEKAKPVEEKALAATEDLVHWASFSAGLQNRLVNIGEYNKDSIIMLQTATNKLLDEGLIPANIILEKSAFILTDIQQALVPVFSWIKEQADTATDVVNWFDVFSRYDNKGKSTLGLPDVDKLSPVATYSLSDKELEAMHRVIMRDPELRQRLQDVTTGPFSSYTLDDKQLVDDVKVSPEFEAAMEAISRVSRVSEDVIRANATPPANATNKATVPWNAEY